MTRGALAQTIRSWRYDPTGSSRDLRLDFLRGLCLFKMVFNHLWRTPLHPYQYWIGYVSAAEGFFFISGAVVGIVHGRRMHEHGLGPTSRTVLTRSLNLYIANLALVFLFMALQAIGVLHIGYFGSLLTPEGIRWPLLFTFNNQCFLHVLPRYVVFLALTPVALWLLKHRRTAWLVAATTALWAANIALSGRLKIPFFATYGPEGFPIASWQMLFFAGLILGYHRHTLSRWWRKLPATWLLPALSFGCVAFAVLRQLYRELGISPTLISHAMGRELLAPGRIINIVIVFALLFVLTDRFWKPLYRYLGALLMPFGQSSLYLFLMHIVVVWLVPPALIYLDLWHWFTPWYRVPLDLLMVGLLWLMIRKRFLFDFVPR